MSKRSCDDVGKTCPDAKRQRSATTPCILDLPCEVLTRIIRERLTSARGISNGQLSGENTWIKEQTCPDFLNITLVCRVFADIAEDLFYQNTFQVDVFGNDQGFHSRFLGRDALDSRGYCAFRPLKRIRHLHLILHGCGQPLTCDNSLEEELTLTKTLVLLLGKLELPSVKMLCDVRHRHGYDGDNDVKDSVTEVTKKFPFLKRRIVQSLTSVPGAGEQCEQQ